MGILVGTASWTDPTLLGCGRFYPAGTRTPEQRLRHYANRFPMVEVDASYYALPSARNAELWAARTPPNFVFDVKAFAAMTLHPIDVRRLPADLRAALPGGLAVQSRIAANALPGEVVDEIWSRFLTATEPLRAAGKLGAILLQFPEWFPISRASAEYLRRCRERLGGHRAGVELRQRTWFSSEHNQQETFALLRDLGLSYVAVDEPQGTPRSVPPVAAVTEPGLALVRFHGQNAAAWATRGVAVAERYRYLYRREELARWVPRVRALAAEAAEVHAVFNNCFEDYGVRSAAELAELLALP